MKLGTRNICCVCVCVLLAIKSFPRIIVLNPIPLFLTEYIVITFFKYFSFQIFKYQPTTIKFNTRNWFRTNQPLAMLHPTLTNIYAFADIA